MNKVMIGKMDANETFSPDGATGVSLKNAREESVRFDHLKNTKIAEIHNKVSKRRYHLDQLKLNERRSFFTRDATIIPDK